jgi:general secretion pathway protein D
MKRKTLTRLLIIWMITPMLGPAALAGSDAKKRFKEGQKLEAMGQIDRAAEEYLAALAEDAGNIQYRIAYQRAASQASVTLVRRGRELMEQGKYEEAYNAFRRAFQFDQTNQLAKDLSARALERQRQVEGISPIPVTETPYGGTIPVTLQTRNSPLSSVPGPSSGTSDQGPVTKDQGQRKPILFRNLDVKDIIKELAGQLGLNVVFDQSVRPRKMDLDLRNVTVAQALDSVLLSNTLFFEPINDSTLLIALDSQQNRMRLQQMSVQTFYLKSADPQMVQQNIQALFQQRVIVMPNAEMRALVVRTTPDNLKLVGDLIAALDKDKPEVLIDINIYEVSQQDVMEIGNQLLFQGFFGSNQQSGAVAPNNTLNILGVTAGQLITEQRFVLGIPTSVLRLLQSRGNSKLIDSLQVHALDSQETRANIGQRIPIQTASLPTSFNVVNQNQQQQQQNQFLGGAFGFGVPQIEYQNVGLNVTVKPTIYNNEDIKLEMEIETSGILSGGDTLTPTFTTRNLKSVATVKSGQAAMMAGVAQKRDTVSRTSLPIIGFLPVIGRFFSVPKQEHGTIDLLITLTPHIIRGADIREEDKLAKNAGMQLQGLSGTVEAFLERREQAKRREQRPIEVTQVKEQTSDIRHQTSDQKIPDRSEVLGLRSEVSSAVNPTTSTSGVALTQAVASRQSLVASDQTSETESRKQKAESSALPTATGLLPSELRSEVSPSSSEPVQVYLQPSLVQPQSGETLRVAVLVNSTQDIQGVNLVLTFNPAVLKVKNVVAGDLFSSGGTTAALSANTDPSGIVTVSLTGDKQLGPGAKQGSLLIFNFDVVSPGDSMLQIDGPASRFVAASGALLQCVTKPVAITAR